MFKKFILLGLVIAFAVVFGFVSYRSAPGEAVSLVRRFGYWQILIVTGFFGYCFWLSLREDFLQTWSRWRSYWGLGLLVVLATGFLHVQERHEFKIVADEVVLQDTAMRMHFEREVSATVRGYDLAGNFTTLSAYVDKRPLFFPFLLSLVHDFTGYRVSNAYYLNGIISLFFVSLLFLLGQHLGGIWGGICAVLLAVSIPLVHQNVTGSGFELLNMVMILATIWLGTRYAEKPHEVNRLGAFLFAGILLAQTRYESALFIAPVGAVILYVWWLNRKVELGWPLFFAPLMLMIVPLHFSVFKLSDAAWQLGDRPNGGVPFGFGFFYDNIGHAMNFFLCTDGSQGNSLIVAVMGAFAMGFFVLTLYRDHRSIFRQFPSQAVICLFLLGLILHTLLMLCYFWGQFDDPIIRRLSLPSHLLLIFALLFVLPKLISHRGRWRFLAVISSLYILGFTLPSASMHRYTQENFAARTQAWISDFIDGLGDDTAMSIDTASGLVWFVHRKSSITVDMLARRTAEYVFHFQNRSFQHYYVVQRLGSDFDHNARFASLDDDLGDGFQLEVVAERSFSPVYSIRISRITGVDVEKIKAWSAKRSKAFHLTTEMKTAIKNDESEAVSKWFLKLP